MDFSFIDDCVEAHILAMTALTTTPAARGRSYFISQEDPYPLWKWIDEVLEYHGLPPVKSSVSYSFALKIATVMEMAHRLLPFLGEPRLTRFLVQEMYTDHYFDISAAKELLGYKPKYTVAEGLQRTFSEEASGSEAESSPNLEAA